LEHKFSTWNRYPISYLKTDLPEDKGTVKLEALDHVPGLIQYLGPPKFQTSKYFEAIHLPMKKLGEQSNQKTVEKYILENNNILSHYKTSPKLYKEDALISEITRKQHGIPKLYSHSAKVKVSPSIEVRMHRFLR